MPTATRKPAAKQIAQQPTIGRVVIFHERSAPIPALVITTVAELGEQQLPSLDSDTHVHLMLLSPAGTRVEWNVPASTFDERLRGDVDQQHRIGTWSWPQRV